jgi:hypothetical protein
MMGQYAILNDNDQKMQSSLHLLLLIVAHVEMPKEFKHTLRQSLHFDGDEAMTLYCAHPVKGAHKLLSIITSCHV